MRFRVLSFDDRLTNKILNDRFIFPTSLIVAVSVPNAPRVIYSISFVVAAASRQTLLTVPPVSALPFLR